ncbi:MAG: phasin family protein [Holophagales bacterium]|nr:phasin family protein [Holophagales bacterium]
MPFARRPATSPPRSRRRSAPPRRTSGRPARRSRRTPRHFVEDVVRTAKSDIDKVRADVSREAGRIADEVARRVTAVVEPALESALHRLNVPTQKDLKTLITKVDGLSRKMDQLHPATPRPRKRKTA